VGIDRESAVRKAEDLVREGKIDLAIEEYLRLAEDQPGDFGAANALGDLYARVGKRTAAANQFVQIGDSQRDSGFVPKAVAFYKKALKVDPASDHALSQLAQIAVEQELYADATLYLNRLIQCRREQNNEAGVAECLVRLGSFPTATADAKMAAARASEHHFSPDHAARLSVDAADALDRVGRPHEAVDVLMQAVSLAPDDVSLRRRVAEACAATGQIDRARAFLSFETAGDHPDLLLALAEQALADGREGDARRALEHVMAVAPDRRVEAEAMLAPLTQAQAPPSAAPDITADFVDVGVDVDVDVDVDGPVDVAAAFGASPDEALIEAEAEATAAEAVAEYGEVTVAAEPESESEPEQEPMPGPEPEPAVEVAAESESPFPSGSRELEWSALLGGTGDESAEETGETATLDDAIHIVPDDVPDAVVEVEAAPQPEVAEPSVEAATGEASQADLDSIAALTAAAQNPALQFHAAAQLGRLLLRLGRVRDGIEWLEQATRATTTVREQRLDVMYEFADALERAGEGARALDVFADLDFDAAFFRDVPERMAALRRALGEGPAT